MEEEKNSTQTADLYITDKIVKCRSLLDIVTVYLSSGGNGPEEDKIETALTAIEQARDEARKAEEALYSLPLS